jgi:ribosomal protein S19E (S16A)
MSQDFILSLLQYDWGSMRALGMLKQLAQQKAAGPNLSFSELQLAKAVEIVGKERVGRGELSERLGLGAGATRTLIERLVDAGLMRISRRGCELTKSGTSLLNELNAKLGPRTEVPKSSITVGIRNFGVLVRGAANKVKTGIELRDAAVKAGAAGAVTLVFEHGVLVMPRPARSQMKRWPSVAKQILEMFQPEENDVIVIAGGDSEEIAEEGARAAAWTLMG